jgi:hypothetical protein
MSDEPFHLDVRVNTMPTEMGLRLDVHSQTCNVMIEIDLDADPILAQSILASLPEFLLHAVERLVADDSPTSAREWWMDGMERLGRVRAEHLEEA